MTRCVQIMVSTKNRTSEGTACSHLNISAASSRRSARRRSCSRSRQRLDDTAGPAGRETDLAILRLDGSLHLRFGLKPRKDRTRNLPAGRAGAVVIGDVKNHEAAQRTAF